MTFPLTLERDPSSPSVGILTFRWQDEEGAPQERQWHFFAPDSMTPSQMAQELSKFSVYLRQT